MHCDKFESRLNHLLDLRQDPELDSALSRHAQACGRCRRLAESYQALAEGLSWLERPQADDDLPRRVLCEVACGSAGASRRPAEPRLADHASHRLPAMLAAAAAVLVAFALNSDRSPERVETSRLPIPQQEPAVSPRPGELPVAKELATAPATAVASDVPMGLLARQATARYADLARDTQAALAGVALLLPSRDEAAPAAGAGPLAADSAASPLTMQLAAGLKPLTESTSGAMDFLLYVLPLGPEGSDTLSQPSVDDVQPPARHDTI